MEGGRERERVCVRESEGARFEVHHGRHAGAWFWPQWCVLTARAGQIFSSLYCSTARLSGQTRVWLRIRF